MIAHKDDGPVYHIDYETILSIVEPGSKVLDLGCGNGELLHRLISEKKVHGRGVEIDERNILTCISKGLSVFQGNIDEGLAEYQDNSYDYVILNQTLQVTHKPDFVIREMLRVGAKIIVSFPNFAYWRIRAQLFFKGTMPKTRTLPFEWYDTPNIRLLSIKDFREFCKNHSLKILYEYEINEYNRSPLIRPLVTFFPNMFATEGVFVITDKHK
ncbi:MAG: methionine biosynthesis protein MetW [Candidatus Auribacter fodinae]|uniref:Methionine biosynthesis protein MetW n=1 Tax=Candidatus Auribacter fodinae TaxID=2093366 RepID=A0A3A4R093_9BACT|nr:MAG: methionine biosynthesis protein MetW [Candidatus Auribacter fodinae]